jgi:Protein of unknown function (DUF1064)
MSARGHQRWTDADLARVAGKLKASIASPLPGSIPARRKYGNTPTTQDGYKFDSKLEAHRYGELKLLLAAGMITDLKLQTRWDLQVNGSHVAYYFSDFDYLDDGKRVVEDAKAVWTPVYSLKKKMLKAQYGIDIVEITA